MNPYEIIVEWKAHLKEIIVGLLLFFSLALSIMPETRTDWGILIVWWFSFVWSVKFIVRYEIKNDKESNKINKK